MPEWALKVFGKGLETKFMTFQLFLNVTTLSLKEKEREGERNG